MRRIIAVISLIALSGCAELEPVSTTPSPGYPVFFQPWSAAIDANAATTIEAAAKAAQTNPALPVIVTGSADTVGSESANKLLSQTRAQVVADALVADGVEPARIAKVTGGEVSAPGTAAGDPAQFSRRVLIRVGN